MAKLPFPAAGSPAVAVGGMPVDPDSDSDKEHPLQEPQFVFHAVDDNEPALLPIHHRRMRTAADKDREERLRVYMIFPQGILCSSTLVFGGFLIYLANSPDVRTQPDFDWDLFVTASSALVMLFSLLSLMFSHLGVYRWLH